MSLELWLVYCVAAIGLSLTPGPNGLLVLTHGMRFGVRRTVFTALGGVSGFFLLVAASLAGLGALLAASEQAFTIAKWIGAAYLVYLGVRTWGAPAPQLLRRPNAREGNEPRGSLQLFGQGFVVAVSNPKALIFFAAFLPQFMQAGVPYWLQLAVLGGTFALVEFIYELVIASAAQRVAPWLGRNGRLFNRIAGVTFVAIGALLARANRP
jgi:homoserine/homoserine lactone efflux protein